MHLSSRTLLLLMPSYLAGAASSSSAAGWPTGSSSGWGKISSGSERQAPALPCLEYYFTGIFEVAGGLKPIPVVGGGGVRVGEFWFFFLFFFFCWGRESWGFGKWWE